MNFLGNAAGGAGDINNDGYDDLLVGADSYLRTLASGECTFFSGILVPSPTLQRLSLIPGILRGGNRQQ